MFLVVADTSPIRYLVQIDQIELLPRLFGRVLIPTVVAQELRHPSAPPGVQAWMALPPPWLEISSQTPTDDPELEQLDPGEKSAISLGIFVRAHLILIDERKGAAASAAKGLATTGTLGVLDLAAAARAGDLQEMGRLFIASHRSMQYDYEISCEEIDFLVDTAIKIRGVYGSRMTGGGFGGCTVNLVAPNALETFRKHLGYAYEERYQRTPAFYDCKPAAGAGRLKDLT